MYGIYMVIIVLYPLHRGMFTIPLPILGGYWGRLGGQAFAMTGEATGSAIVSDTTTIKTAKEKMICTILITL